MAQTGLLLTLAILILSIVVSHRIARRKRRNAVFWGLMAGLLGPLVLPVVLLLKPLPPESKLPRDQDQQA